MVCPDFLLGQFLPGDVPVLQVIRTVKTSVDTVVGQIQRGKEDNTIAVEGQLDLLCDLIHPFDLFRVFAGQKHGSLPVCEAGAGTAVPVFHRPCLLQDLIDQFFIVLVLLRIGKSCTDLLIIDEFLCLQGSGIIICHDYLPLFY